MKAEHLATVLNRAPDPGYRAQVRRFSEIANADATPKVARHRDLLATQFSPAIAEEVTDTVDGTLKNLRAGGTVVLDNKILDQTAFKGALKQESKKKGHTEEVSSALSYWLNNRYLLESDSTPRKEKIMKNLSSKTRSIAYSLALRFMSWGSGIQDRYGTPEDVEQRRKITAAAKTVSGRKRMGFPERMKHLSEKAKQLPDKVKQFPGRVREIPPQVAQRLKDEAVIFSEAMMKGPIWMQMQSEIKKHVKDQKKEGTILSTDQVAELIAQFSDYYQIPSKNNPFLKNPDFAKNLLQAGLSNVITNRGADLVGGISYFAIYRTVESLMDQIGSPATLGLSAVVGAASVYLRGRSDKKALKRDGYSSSLVETGLYTALQAAHNENADNHKEGDAKRAVWPPLSLKSAWFVTNPLYWPFAYAEPPVSTAVWMASYPADQVVYAVSNKLTPRVYGVVERLRRRRVSSPEVVFDAAKERVVPRPQREMPKYHQRVS